MNEGFYQTTGSPEKTSQKYDLNLFRARVP